MGRTRNSVISETFCFLYFKYVVLQKMFLGKAIIKNGI